ncbi:hypothetical protein MPER_07454, partial [Moniliophthora perniciosa FA553]
MPPPTADLATTWAFLEEGVDHIMTKLQTGVSYSKASTKRQSCAGSDLFLLAISSAMSEGVGIGNRAGANLMGSDLYNNLIRYFVTHLKAIRDQTDSLQEEALLRYYAAEWDRYTTGANYIN